MPVSNMCTVYVVTICLLSVNTLTGIYETIDDVIKLDNSTQSEAGNIEIHSCGAYGVVKDKKSDVVEQK